MAELPRVTLYSAFKVNTILPCNIETPEKLTSITSRGRAARIGLPDVVGERIPVDGQLVAALSGAALPLAVPPHGAQLLARRLGQGVGGAAAGGGRAPLTAIRDLALQLLQLLLLARPLPGERARVLAGGQQVRAHVRQYQARPYLRRAHPLSKDADTSCTLYLQRPMYFHQEG